MVGRVFNYNSYYPMLVCANYGHRATGMANKDGGRLGGGALPRNADPGHTIPLGRRKNRGRVPGPGRLYFSAIQNQLLRTGGVQEKQGGMIFEQVCKK